MYFKFNLYIFFQDQSAVVLELDTYHIHFSSNFQKQRNMDYQDSSFSEGLIFRWQVYRTFWKSGVHKKNGSQNLLP